MGLDSVELLVEIEEAFNIEISNLEAEKINTIKDFYEIILEKTDNDQTEAAILQKLKILISEKVGFDIKDHRLDMSIVYDLGLD